MDKDQNTSYTHYAGDAVSVTVTPKVETMSVTVSVQGNNRNSAFADLSKASYTCNTTDGKTALDAVTETLTANKYSYEGTAYLSSVTSPDGVKLGGGDTAYGPWSGWMYSVNGTEATVGLGDYTLADGDAIDLYYVACPTATGDHTFNASGKCTMCGLQKEGKYTLTMADDKTAKVGEEVSVGVTVGYNTDAVTSFNAVDMTFTYDSTKLEYVSVSDTTNYIVGTSDGKVHVLGYGDAKALGEAFSLTFKVIGAATEGTLVTATSAKIDEYKNSVSFDAPQAELLKASTKITTAAVYTVTLPNIFTGETTVDDGADYTFKPRDADHYDYGTVSATVGGKTVEVTKNADGSYTIENVTGNIVVSGTRTAKQYSVTVSGTGKDDVTAADKATYCEDYSFTLKNAEGYSYTVTVTVGGSTVVPTVSSGTYTIASTDVTGAVTISVTKSAAPAATTQITFSGDGAADVVGGTTQTATNGKDFTFEITKDSGYDYTAKLNGETLTPGTDGKYTIPGASINGTALTVTIEKTTSAGSVNVQKYVNLDGTSMWLVSVSSTPGEGKVFTYGGQPMYKSGKYADDGSYVYLVIDETLTKEEAAKNVAVASGTAAGTVDYSGDVNGTKLVDINDAQFVYEMYNAHFSSFESVSMYKFLCADVSDSTPDGSTLLNVNDAVAIVDIILK